MILEEAASWFVEIDGEDIDLAQRKAFDAWLRRSPEHVRAFLELLPVWERGASAPQVPDARAEELITLALKSRSNVVELPGKSFLEHTPGAPFSHRVRRRTLAAFAACALLAVFGVWKITERNIYRTDLGEQRSITLSDGSLIELNARSQVRVMMHAGERRVDLMDGQAIFRVAPDKTRPFVVHSGETSITAVGTEFDVYRKRRGTTVTVLEGRVAVSPEYKTGRLGGQLRLQTNSSGKHGSVLLSAGEQLEVVPTVAPVPRRADLAAATAWTQRQLMFQKTPLGDVADEFNRYNSRPLWIGDSGLREFLVSGTFSSTDPSSLLRFLREQQGIRVVETATEIRIEPGP